MTEFDQLMNKGEKLEAKKLYRRAAEQYSKAFSISIPGSPGCLSYQEKESKAAADRCLSKAKIKVTESCL